MPRIKRGAENDAEKLITKYVYEGRLGTESRVTGRVITSHCRLVKDGPTQELYLESWLDADKKSTTHARILHHIKAVVINPRSPSALIITTKAPHENPVKTAFHAADDEAAVEWMNKCGEYGAGKGRSVFARKNKTEDDKNKAGNRAGKEDTAKGSRNQSVPRSGPADKATDAGKPAAVAKGTKRFVEEGTRRYVGKEKNSGALVII